MFAISKIIIQTTQNTFRRNVRLYCSSGKQFKQSAPNDAKTQNEHPEEDESFDPDDKNKDQSNDGKQRNYDSQLMHRGEFQHISNKNRETFISMVHIFVERDKHRRNHVEFIYAALKHMREFGVERDLSVYKELIDIMPKGKFIPTNMFQAEFMHYPKQQNCIMDLLCEMEHNG